MEHASARVVSVDVMAVVHEGEWMGSVGLNRIC